MLSFQVFLMAGMIPQSFIDDLLGRLPIQDVVASRLPLKRSGTSLKACCPFHQEKTPSFHVLPQKNFYHCFGCGASGDAISFLREFDSLSFNEAVEELARMAGLEVPRDERDRSAFDAQKKLLDGLGSAALVAAHYAGRGGRGSGEPQGDRRILGDGRRHR